MTLVAHTVLQLIRDHISLYGLHQLLLNLRPIIIERAAGTFEPKSERRFRTVSNISEKKIQKEKEEERNKVIERHK